ncbi:MAG: glycosyltransferase family 39 protein [archaeon]|nr:MAG: glycosyltransferase family 39 protein [archaeon]
MLQIAFPNDGGMVFDEAHYIPASQDTLGGIAANAEHPPLPKLISALGIGLLGNNWFGWRFPQVLMQIAAMYLFYLIARRLLGERWGLLATMFLGLDTVWFIHGGTLLIDMPMFLFGLLAIELYMRKRPWLSAASMGLAFTAREMSIFWFGALVIYHLYTNRQTMGPALRVGVKYLAVALLVFGVVMFAYDIRYQPPISTSVTTTVNTQVIENNGTAVTTFTTTFLSTSKQVIWNPIQHVLFIYQYHGPSGIVIDEPYAPYQFAWNWILPFDPVPFNGTYHAPEPFNSATYYRVDVDVSAGNVTNHYIPTWYQAQANLAVWYGFWPALAGAIYLILKRRETGTALFIAGGIALNYAPWLALSVLVRRIGFNYYFIYTLPFVALGLAFFYKQMPSKYGRELAVLNLVLALFFFVWFFPVRPLT